MVSYYTRNLFSEKFKLIGGGSMEIAKQVIEIASWITMIVCNIDSFTQEQIAITIIIMIISLYLSALIHFYEEC